MAMQFNPQSFIDARTTTVEQNAFLPLDKLARAPGTVMKYNFKAVKPKKQIKEIIKILLPEKKKLLFFKFGHQFNIKDRCVVCGTHKVWEVSDPYRPGIPLHKVRKGYPMKGTYCEKHASMYKQYEMLEQKILADEHGLSFSAYVPSPKKLISSGPLTTLRMEDIQSLSAVGWTVKPPKTEVTSKEEELFMLLIEQKSTTERIQTLLKTGTKIIEQEEEEEGDE
tara:strand:+ start:63 stop:734 length:672 start_codon:yes stop_codon:yes gene_type:complete